MTTLSRFIRDLHESGRVVVPVGGPDPEPIEAINAAARAAAEVAMLAAPGSSTLPEPVVLRWGFSTLFQAARFFAHRDLSSELLAGAFADVGPTERDARTIFAVDIGLRHLPTIASWARASATDDPLIVYLTNLGRVWPLSSVGMPGTADVDPAPIVAHPALLALYVDRIIAAGDAARCHDTRVRTAVAAALGNHPPAVPLIGFGQPVIEASP